MENLEQLFRELMLNFSTEAYAEKCWSTLEQHYTEAARHYHNLEHLEAMITEIGSVNGIEDKEAMLFSIFYHDVIYDASRQDNEAASALVLKEHLAETSFDRIEKCMGQIERTKLHEPSDDFDTDTLLDADLSILGQSAEIYKNYAAAIRKEYQIFPDQLYYPGRKAVLEKMLASPMLFNTAYFREKYEQQARENLNAEILTLG